MRLSVKTPLAAFALNALAVLLLHVAPLGMARAGMALGEAAYRRGDYAMARKELMPEALSGNAIAQSNLGVMYANGEGVPKDDQQAVFWYRKAADQGYQFAQLYLGVMYDNGRGVVKDDLQAYFWWLLASAQGNKMATSNRDIVESRLSTSQRSAAQAAARNWKPVVAGGSTEGASADPFAAPPRASARSAEPEATGSGFAVTAGRLVTNAHVVEGCARVSLAGGRATKVHAVDRRSDLALLEVSGLSESAALRAGRLRQGDVVSVVGFPLSGVLASGAQVTSGNVSALAGMQNDSRFIQISAPVQPGNSGGPLLDASGNVVGVVVSKLNALRVAEMNGDIPQNVNFAVSPLVLQGFLEANGVDYQSVPSTRTLSTADVAEKAKRFTFLVQCWK